MGNRQDIEQTTAKQHRAKPMSLEPHGTRSVKRGQSSSSWAPPSGISTQL